MGPEVKGSTYPVVTALTFCTMGGSGGVSSNFIYERCSLVIHAGMGSSSNVCALLRIHSHVAPQPQKLNGLTCQQLKKKVKSYDLCVYLSCIILTDCEHG